MMTPFEHGTLVENMKKDGMYIVLGIAKDGVKFPIFMNVDNKIRVYTTLEEAEIVAKDMQNIWCDTVYFAKNILE